MRALNALAFFHDLFGQPCSSLLSGACVRWQMDFLEHAAIEDVVVMGVVLEEVRPLHPAPCCTPHALLVRRRPCTAPARPAPPRGSARIALAASWLAAEHRWTPNLLQQLCC